MATLILPKLNEKDLQEIPAEAKEKLRFVSVENVAEVLANASVPNDLGFSRSDYVYQLAST